MRYASTRGAVSGLSFEETLFSGYASDGGMLLPECIPALTADAFTRWSKMAYRELVYEIVALFVSPSEVPLQDQQAIITEALGSFNVPDVVSYIPLHSSLNVLELFHGRTAAFKDLALCCVGRFIQYFLNKRKRHVTILVGTSGDTGSAAIEAVRGLNLVDIVVLLPRNRCTEIQELQMTTVIEDNVHVFRVDGTSDDLDVPIKKCFEDKHYVQEHGLCSINSLNWTRIMIQIAHYFYAYFKAVADGSTDNVTIVVPTGALGNLTAGCIAQKMGLPIKLVAAVTNSIVSQALDTGTYTAGALYASHACAMNIQVPYNWERMLHIFSRGDSTMVAEFMKAFELTGTATVPLPILKEMKTVVSADVVDNERILAAMKRCWVENNYVLCPHTAVAAAHVYASGTSECLARNARVVLGVALHSKFPEAVSLAGIPAQSDELRMRLRLLPTKYQDMEANTDWLQILKSAISKITVKNNGCFA